jgi:hypothetical protein
MQVRISELNMHAELHLHTITTSKACMQVCISELNMHAKLQTITITQRGAALNHSTSLKQKDIVLTKELPRT